MKRFNHISQYYMSSRQGYTLVRCLFLLEMTYSRLYSVKLHFIKIYQISNWWPLWTLWHCRVVLILFVFNYLLWNFYFHKTLVDIISDDEQLNRINHRIHLYPCRFHNQTRILNEFRFASNNFEIENPVAFLSYSILLHVRSSTHCLTAVDPV